jgi:outer membrane protein
MFLLDGSSISNLEETSSFPAGEFNHRERVQVTRLGQKKTRVVLLSREKKKVGTGNHSSISEDQVIKKSIRIALIVTASALAASVGFAQAQRMSFVDSEKIINDLPEAQVAQKELEVILKQWQDELQKMSDELQKGVAEYQKKEAVLAAAAKESQQKELADLQQRARDFQAQKFGQNGEAQVLRDKKLAPIREKILKSIEAVAKEEGFTFVFDKANDILLLYADAKFDLTYKVLDRLKRGESGKGK